MKLTLGTDSTARKNIPILRGPIRYFPAALKGVAEVCKAGNDKHNPGEEMHHARGKSSDHGDCIVRHLMDVQDILAAIGRKEADPVRDSGDTDAARRDLLNEVNQLTWRAMALSQELHEKYGGAPLAPGAKLPAAEPQKPSWARCTEESDPLYGRQCNKTHGHEGPHVDVAGYGWGGAEQSEIPKELGRCRFRASVVPGGDVYRCCLPDGHTEIHDLR